MGVLSSEVKEAPTESFVCRSYASSQNDKNKLFMIDAKTDVKETYNEFFLTCRKIAATFNSIGIGKGNIVSYFGETNVNTYHIFFGCIFAGATFCPFNTELKPAVVSQMFEITQPTLIYYEDECYLNLINESLQMINLKTKLFNKNLNNCLVSDEVAEKFQPPKIENSEKHIICILFTSGTTGVPKAVKLTDYGAIYSCLNLGWPNGSFLITTPVFWISNIYISAKCLINNSLIIFPKRKEPQSVLEAIQKYKITIWFSAPSLLLDMCFHDKLNNYDISSLNFLYCGGSQLLLDQRHTVLKNILKGRNILKMIYGSTEAGVVTEWPQEPIDPASKEFGSSGKVFSGAKLVIKDVNNGNILGPGEQGEICIKSPAKMDGYMNKNLVVTDFDEDGWWHMGDIGYYDNNGYIYYVSRLKDVFKYRGTQIAPSELETVLLKLPEIAEVCVVGKPHLIDGEWPAAFVVLKPNEKITEKEIDDFVTAQVPDTFRLRAGVHILKSLPRNAVGKILSKELIKMLE